MSEAFSMTRVWPPRVTAPKPARPPILAASFEPEMSSVPLSTTWAFGAWPRPERASVAPESIFNWPGRLLYPVRVSAPDAMVMPPLGPP